MSLLVVGSVAYDSVTTKFGTRTNSLGGSAMYFSLSASFFSGVSLVAVVGDDFCQSKRALLSDFKIDLSGLDTAEGDTFRWEGIYDSHDFNNRDTIKTELNVFANFSPNLHSSHKKSEYLFLANIDPTLQLDILKQMASRPRLVALDTMDFWIDNHAIQLTETIKTVDVLFMDQEELKSFTKQDNILSAVEKIQEMGPKIIVVKKGEHGVLLFNNNDIYSAPAFPLRDVLDPTGAGDSFAGGFMGYIASTGDISANGLRRATVTGSVMGSFAVQEFSIDRFLTLRQEEIDERFRQMVQLTRIIPLQSDESVPTN